ncbi:hypothetical protein [Actinokineospora iranica]|nr:hypothetical protein [Actinokineospora iranica]
MDTEHKHSRASRVDRLAAEAADAARVRALTTDPDVIALRVEKVRAQVDGLVWAGILLGLAFTMVNVQQFAAGAAVAWSLAWCAAWLLDPMVSLVLIAVLRAEQVTARWQVPETGPWASRTKWFAFAATYTMNTWESWAHVDPAGIVLHSVPPILVLAAAEAGPYLRDRLTEAVLVAAVRDAGTTATAVTQPVPQQGIAAPGQAADTTADPAGSGAAGAVVGGSAPVQESKAVPVRERRPAARTAARKGKPVNARVPARRKLLADYVAEARAAYGPGVNVTPAWVREVTDCSRGLSTKVAHQLRVDLDTAAHDTTPLGLAEDDRRAA